MSEPTEELEGQLTIYDALEKEVTDGVVQR